MDQRLQGRIVHEVGLAQENLVREADLAPGFLPGVQLFVGMLRIDECQDRVEQVALGDLVVHEKCLCYRAGVGQAGGFDHHAAEVEFALALLLGQVGQGAAQVFAYRAADAAVVQLDDLLVPVLHQDLAVDVLVAELVFDHRDLLSVRFGQHPFE